MQRKNADDGGVFAARRERDERDGRDEDDDIAAGPAAARATGSWQRERARPLIWGHRGADHRGPDAGCVENTIEAFAAARAAGADGVELDVRLCASGEVVVFHDADLTRLAGRAARVDALPLAALRRVRLHGDARISTLDEVFEALGPDLRVNVEIKPVPAARAGAVAARVLACIARHRAGARAIVSSFDPVILAQVRARAPRLAVGLLFHAAQRLPLRQAWLARVLRPAALHPEHVLVTGARLAAWRQRGHAVNVWTVDDAAAVRRLAALGVDGIITNDPARALRAITQSRS